MNAENLSTEKVQFSRGCTDSNRALTGPFTQYIRQLAIPTIAFHKGRQNVGAFTGSDWGCVFQKEMRLAKILAAEQSSTCLDPGNTAVEAKEEWVQNAPTSRAEANA